MSQPLFALSWDLFAIKEILFADSGSLFANNPNLFAIVTLHMPILPARFIALALGDVLLNLLLYLLRVRSGKPRLHHGL